MDAPPQFPGAPKKKNTALIVIGVILAICLCCCGICGGGLFFNRDKIQAAFKNTIGTVGCTVAVNEQREALLSYAEKHNGTLPPAKTWQDAIKPYVKRTKELDQENQPFSVPTINDDYCDSSANTAITYNVAVAGKKLDSIEDQMSTVALFESKGRGRNKSGKFTELPFDESPKIVEGAPRGWIRQALRGEVNVRDKNGKVTPIKVRSGGKVEIRTE